MFHLFPLIVPGVIPREGGGQDGGGGEGGTGTLSSGTSPGVADNVQKVV